MQHRYDLWINGQWQPAEAYEQLQSPYSREELASIAQASPADVARAIEAAHEAFAAYRLLPAFRRSQILYRVAELIDKRREELAGVVAREAAKPLKAARAEIARTIETYRFAAEAAKSITGEQVAMDAAEGGEGRIGFTIRSPIGVVTAITPFNFPFNLVAHKVGPALAAGNTIVLKPAEQTPISALLLAELFAEAGLPAGALNIVTGKGSELGETLTTHPLVQKVSFTGSHTVGELIQRQAGLRRTTLELGSNAALIIDQGTDIDAIIDRCAGGAFGYNGQVCISLQRIFVHRSLYDRFVEQFAAAASRLVIGSPLEEMTDVTSMISDKAAERVAQWVEEAVASGAKVAAGGHRVEGEGHAVYAPTVLLNVPNSEKVWTEEVFGPVAVIAPFDDLQEAVSEVNASRYGLMAGVYTPDINNAFAAARELEAGGVVINDIPTFRVDQMPYGGVKDSGKGTEGVAYAVQEMTQIKLISFNLG
ncbi:aldehyde dehydrogenase family protein [Paenibacillaceae bacterium]|nr:aldehyde dehydrogenase family protein [Paenibacillaceae bacterium]